jgi:hypothetical protein
MHPFPNIHRLSKEYWDCECSDKYIQKNSTRKCLICGALRDKRPASIRREVEGGEHFAH